MTYAFLLNVIAKKNYMNILPLLTVSKV